MGLTEKLLLQVDFPALTSDTFELTSPTDRRYNCIAWAAGETHRKWWPDRFNTMHWPKGIPREVTLEAFVAAYQSLGYNCCESDVPETGYEKIAIFARADGKPAHAARQLPSGAWTSKLGDEQDIEHEQLRGVESQAYGLVVQIMRREITRNG